MYTSITEEPGINQPTTYRTGCSYRNQGQLFLQKRKGRQYTGFGRNLKQGPFAVLRLYVNVCEASLSADDNMAKWNCINS